MNNRQIGLQKNRQSPARQKGKPAQPGWTALGAVAQTANVQQALASPETATEADLLKMQRDAGNAAVGSWLKASGLVQREPLTDQTGTLNDQVSGAIQRARGRGNTLPVAVRREMESAFSADLGQVRVHTGAEADHLNRQLSARAFTIGSDIFFRRGAYEPGTERGQHTLRHELTHVVQQGGTAPAGRLKLGAPNTTEEQQAERSAGHTARPAASTATGAQGSVQRTLDMEQLLMILAALQSGMGSAVHGTGAAFMGAGRAIGGAASTAGHAIGGAASTAGHFIGDAASTAGHAIGDAASTAGHAIGGAASTTGRAIKRGAIGVGQYMPLIGDRVVPPPQGWDDNGGIKQTLKNKFFGDKARWQEGKAAGVADVMQNSVFWSLLSAGGGMTSATGALNAFGDDPYSVISQDAVVGTEAAGNTMADMATTIQSLGYLGRSGLDFANMVQRRKYQGAIRGHAMRQAGMESGLNAFMGLAGLTNAGLGAGFTTQNAMAGGLRENNDLSLGIAKEAVAGGASAVSLGARGAKSGMAVHRRSQIASISYDKDNNPTYVGRDLEGAVFPKLKALLISAQTKKAKGQGLDMGKDAMQVLGSGLKSTGYGVGGSIGTYIRLAGTATGIAGSIGTPLIKYFKDKLTDRRAQKAGFLSVADYHENRGRQVDEGTGATTSTSVGEVANETNAVYEQFRAKPAQAKIEDLSVSRLLAATGEFQYINTVFTTDNSSARREAIKNIILSRSATF